MSKITDMFNVIVELHTCKDGIIKDAFFDAANIYRYSSIHKNQDIKDAREQGRPCTNIKYMVENGRSYNTDVLETPDEVYTKIIEAEDDILRQMKALRVPISASLLKPIIVLNEGQLQRHFDANSIYRFEAIHTPEEMANRSSKGECITTVCYRDGDYLKVLETPKEIKEKILEANKQVVKRLQNVSLNIR